MLFINEMFYCCNLKIKFNMKDCTFSTVFVVVKMTERRKNQSEEWTYFTLLFIYFITINKYRFCISVIGYINIQIIGIGYKKINIGRSLVLNVIFSNVIV